MKIFLICPVRGSTPGEQRKIARYVRTLEKAGHEVHWPMRDTDQVDPIGSRICSDNRAGIAGADQVHVWYSEGSQGSVFDFGMAFMALVYAQKKVVLVNPKDVKPTPHKSFQNVLLEISKESLPFAVARSVRHRSNCLRLKVGAAIVKDGKILSCGWNSCSPEASARHKRPVRCLRMNVPPGIAFELCHVICAETAAILNIRKSRPGWQYGFYESHLDPSQELIDLLFTQEELALLRDSTLVLSGHRFACDHCQKFAKLAGIKEIVADELLAPLVDEILKAYQPK